MQGGGLKIRPEYVGHIAQPEIPLFTPVGRGGKGGGRGGG